MVDQTRDGKRKNVEAAMIFRSACPTSALAAWCRALKHGLGVGQTAAHVFRQQARSGPDPLREVAGRIADRLDDGDSVSDALQPEVGRFPALFVETVAVGEQTGRLSDVLGELETHYTTLKAARSRLIVSLLWPAFSLVGSIVAITVMYVVLGMFGIRSDPLGLGLYGTRGAIIFFLSSTLALLALLGVVQLIASDEALKSKLFGVALNIPGLAGCVRAFALQRFSLAWHFLAEAGMKADRTMAVALRSTANRAYRSHEETAAKKLRKGREVVEVLTDCGPTLFPDDYREVARIGEETGQLSEVMKKQATHYQEEAERKMRVLAMAASTAVYSFIGLMIMIAIFRMATGGATAIDPSQNEDLKALEKMAGYGASPAGPARWSRGG